MLNDKQKEWIEEQYKKGMSCDVIMRGIMTKLRMAKHKDLRILKSIPDYYHKLSSEYAVKLFEEEK